MRHSRLLLFALIALSAWTSCNRRTEPLTGLWEFSSFGKEVDENYVDCFLNLREGKYTIYIPDYFDYGTFRQDAQDPAVFRFTSYRKHKYYGDAFWIRVNEGGSEQKKVTLSLLEQAREYPVSDPAIYDHIVGNVTEFTVLRKAVVQFPGEDPYSFNLNRWRIGPDHEESCREVNFRLINYLRHMYALFNGQLKAESEKSGYPFSPSPILFGANGMASKNIKDVPPYWIHTFYNQEQAAMANDMISAIFDEHMVFPRGTKRYDEMWSKLLDQMITIAKRKDFYCGKADTVTVAAQSHP
ncbi:hypothetical protein [Taibaiella chishuiensis]|uniref:Uncharacterized protein n=1 Tax=Taibaiella chishuiensis TaxID=1434707 RepID=A0A2P8D1G8_9BACT|nr:hypothetical protein [Taibaiella chishuiensis]PSK91073.1 hypothetical protein B0I18_10683 [Taibaiella chishuiensis]